MNRLCVLLLLVLWVPVAATAQQSSDDGYVAMISRDDVRGPDGARLEDVGAVLLQDRTNVHGDGPKDPEDQMDEWFGTTEYRADIPQMLDLLYIPEMTKRLILLGGTKVFVGVSDAAGPPRITSIELIE